MTDAHKVFIVNGSLRPRSVLAFLRGKRLRGKRKTYFLIACVNQNLMVAERAGHFKGFQLLYVCQSRAVASFKFHERVGNILRFLPSRLRIRRIEQGD